MKIIARQCPPDWQIHEAFEKYSFQDQNFVITGNRMLSSFYNSEIFQNVKEELEKGELSEALDLMEEEGYCWFLPMQNILFKSFKHISQKEAAKDTMPKNY